MDRSLRISGTLLPLSNSLSGNEAALLRPPRCVIVLGRHSVWYFSLSSFAVCEWSHRTPGPQKSLTRVELQYFQCVGVRGTKGKRFLRVRRMQIRQYSERFLVQILSRVKNVTTPAAPFPIATVRGANEGLGASASTASSPLLEDFFPSSTSDIKQISFVGLFYVHLKNPSSTNSGLSFGIRQNGSEFWIWLSGSCWRLCHCQGGNEIGRSEE